MATRALPQESEKAALIHTGLQPGGKQRRILVNRFERFADLLETLKRWATKDVPCKRHGETVETVPIIFYGLSSPG